MVVPCAQLRVFVPIDTLGPRDRERWAPDAAMGHREASLAEDAVARLRLLTGRGALPEDAVLVRRAGDQQFVCPLQYDVRAAAGLRQLEGSVPPGVLELLLPDARLRTRLGRLATIGGMPTIVDAPWAVPIPWFVLFDDAERRHLDPPGGLGPRLLYVTTVEQALQRLERAVEAVDLVEDAEDLLEELADVAGWLEAFDPRSLLELDYAGLTRLLDPERLAADHSAHDVWQAIEGLESGDLLAAVAYYGALRGRWSALRAQPMSS